MIIVLDTNVIVSGILKPFSKAASILRLVADGTIQLAYDFRPLSEYRDVLSRPQFNFPNGNVDTFLAQIEEEGFLVSGKPLEIHLPDSDDEPFLEVVIAGRVEALVTGNKRHFPMSRKHGGVKILSPNEFVELLKERP